METNLNSLGSAETLTSHQQINIFIYQREREMSYVLRRECKLENFAILCGANGLFTHYIPHSHISNS